MIERNIRLAAYMERLVEAAPDLVLGAPRELSIVCWRVEPQGMPDDRLDALQVEVIEELERWGVAIVSNARLRDGRTALRACIVHFRTEPRGRGRGGAGERGDRQGARPPIVSGTRFERAHDGLPRRSRGTVQRCRPTR
jgi:hypothetical protein